MEIPVPSRECPRRAGSSLMIVDSPNPKALCLVISIRTLILSLLSPSYPALHLYIYTLLDKIFPYPSHLLMPKLTREDQLIHPQSPDVVYIRPLQVIFAGNYLATLSLVAWVCKMAGDAWIQVQSGREKKVDSKGEKIEEKPRNEWRRLVSPKGLCTPTYLQTIMCPPQLTSPPIRPARCPGTPPSDTANTISPLMPLNTTSLSLPTAFLQRYVDYAYPLRKRGSANEKEVEAGERGLFVGTKRSLPLLVSEADILCVPPDWLWEPR